MNFLEIMLGEKLKDADPALDVTGSDRKVLQVVCQDFTNFLKFHWDLIGKEASQCELVEKLEKIFKENPSELEEFLTVWIGVWLKKWKQRVKNLKDKERLFTVVNNALRKARGMAQSQGPLIFVKIDKGYYGTTHQ